MARELDLVFPLPLGLHARPASRLCELARGVQAQVTFTNHRTGRTASARSALALVATLTRQGDRCSLRAEGADEGPALEALRAFAEIELPHCDDLAPEAPAPVVEGPLPRALATSGARVLRGTATSRGISRGPAFVLDPWEACRELADRPAGTVAEELASLAAALERVAGELAARRSVAVGGVERAILDAHGSILGDEEWRASIEAGVRQEGLSAGQAVLASTERFVAVLEGSGSTVLRERVSDLRDLAALVVRELARGAASASGVELPGEVACVAPSLGPAQLLSLDRSLLKGLALGSGGQTSHTAILARSLGIPCVTGLGGVERLVESGQELVVDGERGLVVLEPPEPVRAFYDREAGKLETLRERALAGAAAVCATADGRRLEVGANVGSTEETRLAFAQGAEGIGLFRTELLFLGRATPPTEDEQAESYSEAVRLAAGRPVMVRTLDAGGDKPIPYLGLPAEPNPFLGVRAVRMYGAHPDLVGTQVRAILRASAHGPVRVMVPMVCCVEEVRAFRALVRREQEALAASGVPFDPRVEVGIMVEIPSVAFLVDRLAPEVDFFSIGSNDLAQYFLAVDRDNPAVAGLYSPFHPAFWRLLRQIVDEAHRHDRWVGLCGELAGNLDATPLLVGLGLDELSVAPPLVPAVKAAVRECDGAACRALLGEVTERPTAAEVERLLRERAAARCDRALCAEALVRLGSTSRTRDEAIRELVDLLHLAGRTDDPDGVEDAIWRREDTCSTGVGFGVAIPHCRSRHVSVDSIALLGFERGVDWEALDGEPVGMAILVALSEASEGDAHLRMIAALSRRLMDDEYRERLRAAVTPAEAVARMGEAIGTGGG